MTARCELTELLVDQCAHCRQLDDCADTTPFRARYWGSCPRCESRIEPGELIEPDADTRYIHSECA